MVKNVKKVEKRKIPTFKRSNYGAKRRSRVKDNWRTPRGNDNHMRIKKKNVGVMPMIGFKNAESVRFLRQDGSVERLIHNKADLESISGKEGITAKFSHDLSKRTRMELQKIADERKIKISNSFKPEKKPEPKAVKDAPAGKAKDDAKNNTVKG
jgi:large subunit ribosomal protein L32e